mgnify:FL=1
MQVHRAFTTVLVGLIGMAGGQSASAAEPTAPGGIVDAALSPDGGTLAAACGDRSVRLWSAENGTLRQTLRGHAICASAVDYCAANGLLASGGWDGRVIVWNPEDGSAVAKSAPGDEIVQSLKWIGDGEHLVAVCSDGGERREVALNAETLEVVREGETIAERLLEFSPDGTRMAAVKVIQNVGKARRLEIVVEDTLSGDAIRTVPVAWERIDALAFSPDAKRLVVSFRGEEGRGMALVDTGSGDRIWTATRERGDPNLRTLTFSRDGRRIAGFAGGRQRPIAFADSATGELWIGEEHAKKLAENEKAAEEAKENGDEAFVPWHPFKGLRSGWLRFSQDGDSVYTVGRGALVPRGWDIHTAEATVEFAVPKVDAPEPTEVPDGDISFQEVFDAQMDKDTYTLVAERDSLFWVGGGPRNGLHFNVRGDIKDRMARDYLQREWPVGTRPFEVACEYVLPVNKYWQAARGMAGWWIGLSSGPVERMTDKDITVMINVTPGSFFAGVLGGPPLDYHCPFDPQLGRSVMTEAGLSFDSTPHADWQVSSVESELRTPDGTPGLDVEGRQVYLQGTQRRDIEMTLRISRSADNVLTFAVHRGRRLQSEQPFWSARWVLPEPLAGIPLSHLVVKRSPIPNHHPVWAMQGRITALKASLDPPFCREFRYLPGHEVLRRGAVIEVLGSGFDPDCHVEVGGYEAGVRFVDETKLRVTLPDLAEGRQYELCAINPNKTWSFLPEPLPFGAMLTGVEPSESLPAGGRMVEVVGAGFSEDTEILFGETPVAVAKVLSPTRATVQVPPGEAGPVALTARTGKHAYAGTAEFGYAAHPYLFYTAETVPEIREKFNDPFYAAYKRTILAGGNAGGAVVDGKDFSKNLYPLIGAWVCTGEDKYRDKALELVDVIIARLDKISYGQFSMMGTFHVALAYDALFADLSQEQRHGLQQYLRRSIQAHMQGMPQNNNDDQGRSIPEETWFYTNISNTNAVGNGGAGMACLALRNSSAMARTDLQYAIEQIRKYAEHCIQPDGANIEGSFYAGYGQRHYFRFAEALAHANGDTQLLDMPNLEQHQNYYKAMLAGNGRMYMYSDAYPHFPASVTFASLARHYDQDFMRWMAKHHGHKGFYGLLFRDDKPAPEQAPPLPTLHVLESKSIASLRSTPELHANMTVCVKGNDNTDSHHCHTDIGHIMMVLNGELMLSDDGYWNPSRPEHHSILFIDGQPPDKTGGWITESWEHGPWRAVVLDMRIAYIGMADRIRRHVVMHDDKALIVLDDIVPDEDSEGIVTSYFQAGGDVDLGADGNNAVIQGRRGRLCIRSHGPGTAFNTKPGAGAEGTIKNPIWGSYKATPDKPMVTVMLAAPPDGDRVPDATIARRDDAIAVTLPDGESILFKETEMGWAFITKDDDPRPLLSKPERNTEIPEGAKTTKSGYFEDPPRIDGLLGDKAWKDCEVIYDFKIVTGALPADHPGKVRIGYDEKNLYMAIECLEKNLPGVVADVTERDGPCNLDDSVEIFIDTNLDRKTYFQFMINANGVLYDGFGWNARWDADDIRVETALSPNKDAWLLEIAIPWKTLELDPPDGTPLPMGLQIARNHFQSEELSHWAPTGTHNNHMPWMYGVLVFE